MQRTIKSFILRTGRVSNRQQQGLDLWLKEFELVPEDSPWSLFSKFNRHADTIVEIGFGMGQSLLTMAQNNPQMNYIGIEVHKAGIGSLAADLHDHQMNNVRIAPFDAMEVFRTQLAPDSLTGIQIFFPDPWHKKKHHKRRLIQPEFIQLAVNALKNGGFIHCATDWQDYAEHILKTLTNNTHLQNIESSGGYCQKPDSRPNTKFELRGERLGHKIWDIIFIKNEVQ